ncbi:MAG: hypothetical protein C5B60_11890 [Chloroflexi bacterium]|nr:MAG: hypothetical protein C5B60_11890 [Chloroflexota bacterium]
MTRTTTYSLVGVAALVLLAGFLLLRPVPLAAANTYYVSTSGNDANPCDATGVTSRQHVSLGIHCLNSGDTLIVRNGTYNTADDRINGDYQANHSRNFASGTSDTNRTTIRCESHLGCTLAPPDGTPNVDTGNKGIAIPSNQNWITISDFVLDGTLSIKSIAGTGADAGGIAGNASHIVISNNEIKNAWGFAVVTGSGTDNHLDGNSIHDNTGPVLPACGGQCGYGVYTGVSELTINNNDFYNNGCYAIHNYGGNQDFNSAPRIISNNKFHNNGLLGCDEIRMNNGGATFFNNLFYDHPTSNSGNAVNSRNCNTRYYNNTFYNIPGTAIDYFPCGVGGGGQLTEIRNNVFVTIGTAIFIDGTTPSMSTIQQNLCSTPPDPGNPVQQTCFIQSTAAAELVNPTTDFHLKAGALARVVNGANGVNLTNSSFCGSSSPPCTIDKGGVGRPNAAWDLGAYQFSGSPPPPNITPLDDFVYSIGADLDTLNGGSQWLGPWVKTSGLMTIQAAPSGSFSGGNAARSQGAAGSNVLYQRQMQAMDTIAIPTALTWQMRSSINNLNGYTQVSFGNSASGLGNGAVRMWADGHLKACQGMGAADLDLGAYNANQWYRIDIELNAAAQAGKYRVIVDLGTPSAWMNMCETTATPDRFYLVDYSTNTHDFWVDTIGARATMLAFTTEPPASTATGATFAANASVTYSNGQTPVPGRTDSITLSVCPSTPIATLTAASGLTKAAVNGTASWTDLVLTQSAGAVGVLLCAHTGTTGIADGESTGVDVTAGPPPLTELAAPARIRARTR